MSDISRACKKEGTQITTSNNCCSAPRTINVLAMILTGIILLSLKIGWTSSMLSAERFVKVIQDNGGLNKMMKFLIGAVFCGVGAFFPFQLVDDDMEVVSDEV